MRAPAEALPEAAIRVKALAAPARRCLPELPRIGRERERTTS